jgi:transposase
MAENIKKLTPKQKNAIVCLMECKSIEDAAKRCGIGTRTLYRWLKQTSFLSEYEKTRDLVFGQAIARLQKVAGLAAEKLEEILKSKKASNSVKVRAAHTVLEHARQRDDIELHARIPKDGHGVLLVNAPMTTNQWLDKYKDCFKQPDRDRQSYIRTIQKRASGRQSEYQSR